MKTKEIRSIQRIRVPKLQQMTMGLQAVGNSWWYNPESWYQSAKNWSYQIRVPPRSNPKQTCIGWGFQSFVNVSDARR
jgi:hypothetical protein